MPARGFPRPGGHDLPVLPRRHADTPTHFQGALAVEIHEEWAEGPRYLDLSVLPAGAGCTARLAEAA